MAATHQTPQEKDIQRTISTFVDQTRIQLTRQRRKKTQFFKTSLPVLNYASPDY